MRGEVVWQALQWPSLEHVSIDSTDDGWTADGATETPRNAVGPMCTVADALPATIAAQTAAAPPPGPFCAGSRIADAAAGVSAMEDLSLAIEADLSPEDIRFLTDES